MTAAAPDTTHPATPRTASSTRRPVVLGVALLLLGLGAAALALLGPLGTGWLEYHVSAGADGQLKGGDVAALALVAPVSIVAAVLVLKGHRLGAPLALAPGAYGLYMYFQLAMSGDPVRYPGNSEFFYPLLLGMFLVCGLVVIVALQVAPRELPLPDRRVDRSAGMVALLMAVFLTLGLHLPGLVAVWRGNPSTEFLDDPGLFWIVKTMDLGVVVPLMLVLAVLLLRRPERAGLLRHALLGGGALLVSSVAGMAVVMQATGDPASSWVNTAAFGIVAVAMLYLAWLVYRPLLSDP